MRACPVYEYVYAQCIAYICTEEPFLPPLFEASLIEADDVHTGAHAPPPEIYAYLFLLFHSKSYAERFKPVVGNA